MATLAELSDSLAALAASVAPRLVAVEGADGGTISGFILRKGLAVTAHEALEGDDDVTVIKPDGSRVTATLTGRDPTTDVALLSYDTGEAGDWAPAPMPKPGSLALLAGAGEYGQLASLASIIEVGPAWRSMRGGEIDARITLGLRLTGRAEGAAVVAPDGNLVGMAVNGARRRTLVIPTSTIARAVTTLSEKGYIPRGWLGVSLHPMGGEGGAIVVGIESEGPAARAGFLVGDIITTWGGEPVKNVSGVSERLASGKIGTSVKLGVMRGGTGHDLDVTIGERPRR